MTEKEVYKKLDEVDNVQEEKDIKNDLYGTKEYVRISDINKEIARNWKKEKK
jgi:hypothetical protein